MLMERAMDYLLGHGLETIKLKQFLKSQDCIASWDLSTSMILSDL